MSAYIHLAATVDRDLTNTSRDIIAKKFLPRGEVIEATPAYTDGLTATWHSPLFNREAADMVSVRGAIWRALHGRQDVEILFVTDSKGRRAGVYNWPDQFEHLMGAVTGLAIGSTEVNDDRWTAQNFRVAGDAAIGLTPTNGSEGLEKWAEITPRDTITGGTWWVRVTAGGDVTLTVDGTDQTITIPSQSEWTPIELGTLDDTLHTTRVASTADSFEVLGIGLTYAGPRLKMSNVGRASTEASEWVPGAGGVAGRWPSVIDAPTTSPDLIVSALGTNGITNLAALTEWYDALATLGVPVVIVSPGGIDAHRGVPETTALQAHLASIAQQRDWMMLDHEQVIGTFAVADAHGLMADTLHESNRGAYLEAVAMKEALA